MQPKDFVFKYTTAAKNAENVTWEERTSEGLIVTKKGFVNKIITLTQGAVESKWGDVAPGYNFFGVKDTDGINGNEQLLLTHEYLDNPNGKFPKIQTIAQIAAKRWKYTVYDYFRRYDSPEDAFRDHSIFLCKNERYKEALLLKDPIEALQAIAKAGYATDPDYASLLTRVAQMIMKYTN